MDTTNVGQSAMRAIAWALGVLILAAIAHVGWNIGDRLWALM